MRARFFGPVGVVLVASVAQAQALDANDTQLLQAFDQAYAKINAQRANIHKVGNRVAYFTQLQRLLDTVSASGKATDEWKKRQADLDELKALGNGPAPATPKAPAQEGLSNSDRATLMTFAERHAELAKYKDRLNTMPAEDLERRFKHLQELLDRVSEPGKATDEWKRHQADLDALKAAAAEPAKTPPAASGTGGFAEPRPEPAPTDEPLPAESVPHQEAWQAYFDAHRADLESPAGKDELDLRCMLADLEVLADEVTRRTGIDAKRFHAARVDAWEVRRLAHGLDAVFGPPTHAPWGSPERDRLASIEAQGPTLLGRGDRLTYQDAAVAEAARGDLRALRQRLDELAPKLRRTHHYVAAEASWRRTSAELERRIAAAQDLGKQAGDVGAQLAGWKETFPFRTFDPSYKGALTPDGLRAWGRQLRNWKDGVRPALAFFERASKVSQEAQSAEFRRYVGWFEHSVPDAIDRASRTALGPFQEDRADALRAAQQTFDESTTPEFRERMFRHLAEGVEAMRLLVAFSEGFDGRADPALLQDQQKITSTVARLQEEAARAVRERRLPEAVSDDAKLLAEGRRCVEEYLSKDEYRGLRVSSTPWRYDYREATSDGWIRITWWESFRVDFAARKKGTDSWFWESFTISRRLNQGGGPIGDWGYSGPGPEYGYEMLLENVDR